MVSLKLKSGTAVEVERGEVYMVGSCVVLEEHKLNGEELLVTSYCLFPGEIVRRVSEGVYVVEF